MNWRPILYDTKCDLSGFECDEPIRNDYLKTKAADEHARDLSKLYIVINDESKIGGFYTISNGSIRRDDQLPQGSGKRNYPYRFIGTVHIGRLARDKTMVSQKLGTKTMHMALTTAAEISNISAAAMVTVDAKNQRAENFYRGFGFDHLLLPAGSPDYPKPLYIKIKNVRLIVNPNYQFHNLTPPTSSISSARPKKRINYFHLN